MGEQRLLHRSKRDLSWDDVETFYEDKNNFAMYLVLPIIVIVYGGCAVIYCIARCRRYLKRRKRKPKRDSRLEENEPLDDNEPDIGHRHPSIPVISTNQNGGMMDRAGASSSSEVRVSMDQPETPLPWQVPGDRQPLYPIAATAPMKHDPPVGFSNKGYDHDVYTPTPLPDAFNIKPSPPPPPSYEETYPKVRPGSKPPPYEEKINRQRRGSVEEIIALDPLPINTSDRKRRHPGSRPTSKMSNSQDAPVKEAKDYEEERERARQLIRGERPKREVQPDKLDRDKTPDIISHARTKPLEPRYKPAQPNNAQGGDALNMAKQAAQLLRLDHIGKQQGKKQKRLVFVAE